MDSELTISRAYRTSSRLLKAVSIISILWSIAQLEFKSVSFDAINLIELDIYSIPIAFALIIIFFCSQAVFDYLQQSIAVRRSKHARVDFQVNFYLVLISILALSISVEKRSIIFLLALLSLSIPFQILVTILGTIIGFIFLFIRQFILTPKVSGIAAYVSGVLIQAGLIIKLAFIATLFSIGFLYSFTSFFDWLSYKPSIPGVWSTIIGFSLVIVIYTRRKELFENVFCFRIYDSTTETLYYYNEHGQKGLTLLNVDKYGKWTGKNLD